PVGIYVNTFGTGKVTDEKLQKYVEEHFDMRPKALIDELGLLAPQYHPTSAYGHFGRSEFSWEKVNRAAVMAADLLGGKVKGTEIVRKASATTATNGHTNGNGTNGVHAVATGKKAGKAAKKAGKKSGKSSKKDKRAAAEA
ncbi:MAG: S-adenosylmethionine synthetase, partial [Myxococcaceae bacterium]|nr:S-adenosylmethionine synthetase [Myxococcaceae bacterium]